MRRGLIVIYGDMDELERIAEGAPGHFTMAKETHTGKLTVEELDKMSIRFMDFVVTGSQQPDGRFEAPLVQGEEPVPIREEATRSSDLADPASPAEEREVAAFAERSENRADHRGGTLEERDPLQRKRR